MLLRMGKGQEVLFRPGANPDGRSLTILAHTLQNPRGKELSTLGENEALQVSGSEHPAPLEFAIDVWRASRIRAAPGPPPVKK